MVFIPPPEVFNEDHIGCSHCGRLRSRKWLFVNSEQGVVWYCAGAGSKSQCREKAKRQCATVWPRSPSIPESNGGTSTGEPETFGDGNMSAPSSSITEPDTDRISHLVLEDRGSDSCQANAQRGPQCPPPHWSADSHESARLAAVLKSALESNNAALLSEVLSMAHRAGLSVTDALAAAGQQLAPGRLTLPPRFAAVFYDDRRLCFAAVEESSQMGSQTCCTTRALSSAMVERFGLNPHLIQQIASGFKKAAFLQRIMHVDDVPIMASSLDAMLKSWRETSPSDPSARKLEMCLPPLRLANSICVREPYTMHHPHVQLEATDGGGFCSLVEFKPVNVPVCAQRDDQNTAFRVRTAPLIITNTPSLFHDVAKAPDTVAQPTHSVRPALRSPSNATPSSSAQITYGTQPTHVAQASGDASPSCGAFQRQAQPKRMRGAVEAPPRVQSMQSDRQAERHAEPHAGHHSPRHDGVREAAFQGQPVPDPDPCLADDLEPALAFVSDVTSEMLVSSPASAASGTVHVEASALDACERGGTFWTFDTSRHVHQDDDEAELREKELFELLVPMLGS